MQKILLMSILARFPLADRPEGTKLYDWLLSKFKSHNFCATDVTYGFVSDLQGLLQMKKSRHEVAEDNKLLRKELCHLIIYLVARIDIGCVTDNIVRVVCKLLKVSDKDKHNPEELWAQGIDYIRNACVGYEGGAADDGEHEHVGAAEPHPRRGDGGQEDKSCESGGAGKTTTFCKKKIFGYIAQICKVINYFYP